MARAIRASYRSPWTPASVTFAPSDCRHTPRSRKRGSQTRRPHTSCANAQRRTRRRKANFASQVVDSAAHCIDGERVGGGTIFLPRAVGKKTVTAQEMAGRVRYEGFHLPATSGRIHRIDEAADHGPARPCAVALAADQEQRGPGLLGGCEGQGQALIWLPDRIPVGLCMAREQKTDTSSVPERLFRDCALRRGSFGRCGASCRRPVRSTKRHRPHVAARVPGHAE